MSLELPDGLRGVVLIGHDGSVYRVIGVNTDGYLVCLLEGTDSGGTPRPVRVDGDGQMIAILKGASGYNLDVDSSGFLTTVIKGNYGGSLRTVKLDDDGRLSAFVIDSVDAWDRLLTVGNAELAARLGSINRYDRRGQVQLAESFINGLQRWTVGTSGTGASVDLSPDYYLSNGYSVALTGGSDTLKSASIAARLGIIPAGLTGIECAFSIPADAAEFRVQAIWYDGTTAHLAMIKGVGVSAWSIYDENAAWQSVLTHNVYIGDAALFHRIKFVFDLSTGYYVRLQLDEEEVDISSYQYNQSVSAYYPFLYIYIVAYSRATYNDIIYIDDVIITVAEPS